MIVIMCTVLDESNGSVLEWLRYQAYEFKWCSKFNKNSSKAHNYTYNYNGSFSEDSKGN